MNRLETFKKVITTWNLWYINLFYLSKVRKNLNINESLPLGRNRVSRIINYKVFQMKTL